MKTRLTDKFVVGLKSTGGLIEHRDTEVKGLELRLTKTGHRAWALRYRRKSDGRKMVTAIGPYDAERLNVAEARRRASALRVSIADGADPAGESQAQRVAMTFRELAELRLERDVKLGEGSRQNYRQSFNADVYPAIGDMAAADITPDMIARILDRIEERGAAVHADRTKAAIGSTFRWAIKTRRAGVTINPAAGLGKRADSVERTRVLTDDELRQFWHAIGDGGHRMTLPMRIVVKLAVLTGQRRREVCGARIEELHLDGPEPMWIIPGDRKSLGKTVEGRTKNGREQRVPLSRQAAELWRQALALTDGNGHVFPAKDGAEREPHLHHESVSKAVRRMRKAYGIEDVTIHDMRRCVSTWAGERGVMPDVLDKVLNHAPQGVTRKHYNHALLLPQVRTVLQAWADHVWVITGQMAAPETNVVSMAGRRTDAA